MGTIHLLWTTLRETRNKDGLGHKDANTNITNHQHHTLTIRMDMEEEQQQQQQRQQPQQLHHVVVDGIARLSDPRHRKERHKLIVDALFKPRIDRQSLEHLVNFLDDRDSHEVVITELELDGIRLNEPPDGGLDVLRSFFARSDTTLTKVALKYCHSISQEDASHLLTAFQTNRTVTDLTIHITRNLEGAALGACLSGLLLNMPQLQCLECSDCVLRVDGVRAFQPALQANRTLKTLTLSCNLIGDDGIRLIADALVGNTTMEVLSIGFNEITSDGLDDITRLIESTWLQTIDLIHNPGVFDDEASTQRFVRVLSRHEFLKKLNLSRCGLGDEGIRLIADALVGNTIMESLDISECDITSNGLDDITRLIKSTKLKTIYIDGNVTLFVSEASTQRFVSTLQHKKSSVQELPGINPLYFPVSIRAAAYASIKNSLKCNEQLNRVNLLLAPPPPQQQQHQQRHAGTMMLKTWHKAITKFAMVPNNAGASAIFKLFQARPSLLEKRLKRPPAADAAGSPRQHQDSSSYNNTTGNDDNHANNTSTTPTTTTTNNGRQKRQRL